MRVAMICLTTAGLALAACQPAPENGVEEQSSAENIAEVEGPEAAEAQATPSGDTPTTNGADETAYSDSEARWFVERTRAAFGPPESEALLSIRCASGTLMVQRVVGRPLEGNLVASMNFLGNDANTMVRVTNKRSELGGSLWEGEVLDAAQIATVIGGGNEMITVDIEGSNAIRVRPSVRAAEFVRECGR